MRKYIHQAEVLVGREWHRAKVEEDGGDRKLS